MVSQLTSKKVLIACIFLVIYPPPAFAFVSPACIVIPRRGDRRASRFPSIRNRPKEYVQCYPAFNIFLRAPTMPNIRLDGFCIYVNSQPHIPVYVCLSLYVNRTYSFMFVLSFILSIMSVLVLVASYRNKKIK